jgi:hypothetical protein
MLEAFLRPIRRDYLVNDADTVELLLDRCQ